MNVCPSQVCRQCREDMYYIEGEGEEESIFHCFKCNIDASVLIPINNEPDHVDVPYNHHT